MKNKFIAAYGIAASAILILSVVWFFAAISTEAKNGTNEAEKSFSWIKNETVSASLADGFMTDAFIRDLTAICQKSHLLSAVVINTPSGAVFAWPQNSTEILYGINGEGQIAGTSFFIKSFSAPLDIGDGTAGSIAMVASINVLSPDAIFAACRNSFIVILALLFGTIIVIVTYAPDKSGAAKNGNVKKDSAPLDIISGVTLSEAPDIELIDDTAVDSDTIQAVPDDMSTIPDDFTVTGSEIPFSADFENIAPAETQNAASNPEGLFSPVTGTGWEQYLLDRLDAELVRAASSEQDLSLIIIRIAGLNHTDELAKKIAKVLLETFRFRDMVFEYGSNGFAGILQNMNLDEAMKTADTLYAGIDSILMEAGYDGQITIGITTRTARLLPASRMIEEASSAARKAEEEPSLPIVAFRANPEKYRNFVAERG
jgi:GGDEF domain-containing protein